LVVGGWWLVVGGWWLVVGGWWLVVGGWCLVVCVREWSEESEVEWCAKGRRRWNGGVDWGEEWCECERVCVSVVWSECSMEHGVRNECGME
jgi:hypothetical protein